uniref:Regulatory protein RecX n=1 Tax=candidate division WOR-3 bacterium TaxID=2052148 RepID=A0A7V3VT71_UNCW3
MKISKIEVQKRNKKRSSIYIDGEFRFGLSNDIILKYDLKEGDEITEEEINKLLIAEEKERLKQKAFRLLRYRNRSVEEMKQKLLRSDYEPELVDEVVRELVDDHILDDRRFACDFVSEYTEVKPKGNLFIINELKRKKVNDEYIQAALEKRDEKGMIRDIINKKFPKLNKKDIRQKAKVLRYLISRGFTPNLVYEILGEDYE